MWHLLAQSSDIPDAAGGGIIAAIMGMQLFIGIGLYLIMGIALMTLANKTNTPNPWMAWIPIANIILMVQIAELEIWWAAVVIVTCTVASFYVWMKIAERRGKPSWVGLLMLVPCVNFFVPLYLAFAD